MGVPSRLSVLLLLVSSRNAALPRPTPAPQLPPLARQRRVYKLLNNPLLDASAQQDPGESRSRSPLARLFFSRTATSCPPPP